MFSLAEVLTFMVDRTLRPMGANADALAKETRIARARNISQVDNVRMIVVDGANHL